MKPREKKQMYEVRVKRTALEDGYDCPVLLLDEKEVFSKLALFFGSQSGNWEMNGAPPGLFKAPQIFTVEVM